MASTTSEDAKRIISYFGNNKPNGRKSILQVCTGVLSNSLKIAIIIRIHKKDSKF